MPPTPLTTNTLFYGDNLDILREYIADASIDLVYLDPPFNSNRNYNVLFKDERGAESEAQITAFEDTWHWGHDAERTYVDLVTDAPERVGQVIGALRSFIGTSQMRTTDAAGAWHLQAGAARAATRVTATTALDSHA